jgi:hypothetical protein
MNTNLRMPIATLAFVALAIGACGDDDPSTSSPTRPPDDASADELADGRHFGFVVGDGSTASFDVADFLTGDDADAAAAEDGLIADGGEIENDYYVRNPEERAQLVDFGEDAVVRVVDCEAGCGLVAADTAALLDRATPTPVWLTVRDGVVVDAEEQYLA